MVATRKIGGGGNTGNPIRLVLENVLLSYDTNGNYYFEYNGIKNRVFVKSISEISDFIKEVKNNA